MKSLSVSLAPHFKFRDTMSPIIIEEREYMFHVLYVSAVGNLMYAMMCIMPYLSQDISMVSKYMHYLSRVIERR